MIYGIIIVLLVAMAAMWDTARDAQAAFEKESREHMEACREIGRLIGEVDRLRAKHKDYEM